MIRRTPFARGLLAATLLAMFISPVGGPVYADAESLRFQEYQVKAAFLYSFARFVEWPEEHALARSDEIRIGIVGEDPFRNVLDRTLRGKTILGRTPVVQRYETAAEVEACHVLFVAADQAAAMSVILGRLGDAPVLTVGESDGFVEAGGIIRFIVEKNRVRFEIKPSAARRIGLKLSSKLLGVARVV